MPAATADYFRYLPLPAAMETWGLAVTAAGFTVIKPGSPYPPTRHPSDHELIWDQGRRLDALQIISILGGSGWFESEATGLKRLTPGSAFLVIPMVWHRYRPDPRTGWTESWMELRGPIMRRLCKSGVLSAKSAVGRQTDEAGLNEALEAVHARMRHAGNAFDPELTARGFGVLAAWARVGRSHPVQTQATRAILEAERYFALHYTEPLNIAELASKLGIAYSHFRRQFTRHTGYAPWAYVLRLRLLRARRVLATEQLSLEEIARQLGFSSAFHFSAAFKKAFGDSPTLWRKQKKHRRP